MSIGATDYMAGMQGDDPSLSNARIIEEYAAGIDELRAAVAGMTAEEARARPVPGRWSTIEVVAHVADTEIYFTDRVERTLALDKPLLMGVDERPYVETMHYQELDLAEQIALFVALRQHLTRILRFQNDDAWARQGIHTETGLVSVRQLVLQAIRHARHHLPFIEEKRRAMAKG